MAEWERVSGPREVEQIGGYDMSHGWGYTIKRGNEERTIGVIVAASLIGGIDALPPDAKAAYQTCGRSAVDAVLDQAEPPRYLVITSAGIHEDSA